MADEIPILPTIREVIGPAKDTLAEARPAAAPHLDRPGSMYQKVLMGWRGQFTRAAWRLAAETTAARLGLATGVELTETARSNYDTPRNEDPTRAIGEVSLVRTVVHYRAYGGTINTADATDGSTAGALLIAIASAMNGHLASVYSSSTGLGSHQVADAGVFTVIGTATMGDLVNTTTNFLLQVNWHFNNKGVGTANPPGSNGGGVMLSPSPHLDADADRQIILATNPTSSNPGGAFSAATKAEQQALLIALNTMKRALNIHFALEAPGGTIRKGTRVTVTADPTSVPPTSAATYEVPVDTFIRPGAGSRSHGLVAISVEATNTGSQSNQPFFSDRNPTVTIQGALFDAAQTYHLEPVLLRAAGGSAGQGDRLLRAAAAATWRGSSGPTNDALLAGALRSAGVAHYAELEDAATGRAWVYITDESWAQSTAWLLQIKQILLDDWIGTGQRLGMGTMINQVIRVRLTVVLRDSRYLADPTSITDALKTALKGYFDDRQDWYIWKLSTLRGRCVAADKRVLKVTSAAVLDGNGVPLTEPAVPSAGSLLTHYRFEDNALEVTYDAPN